MRPTLPMALESEVGGFQAHFPLGEFTLHLSLDARSRQRRHLIMEGGEVRFRAISGNKSRFPRGQPATQFRIVFRHAIHHRSIKKGWGLAGDLLMSPESATQRRERL